MSHHSRQWLFSILRRLLDNPFTRRSIRGLLALCSILRRQFLGRRPLDKAGDGATFTSQTISSGPELPSSGACTSASVIFSHAQPQQQPLPMSGHNRFHGFVNDSVMSPSYAPESIHPHPYLIPGSNASRSSQDLGTVPVEEYALDNISNHHLSFPPPLTEGLQSGPSPDAVDIQTDPLRASPVPSVDLAIPAGQIPGISRPALSSVHPSILPIAPMDFKRYDRNKVMHVYLLCHHLNYLLITNIRRPQEETDVKIEPLTTTFTQYA
jgi:hypothetical protein